MSTTPDSSRPPPPVVVPLEHDGIRYAPDDHPPVGSGSRQGGYLAAFDAKTGVKLWSALVYDIQEDPFAPIQPGRHFKSLSLLPGATGIDVEDEYGVHYAFDFATRTAQRTSPVATLRDMPIKRPLPVPPKPPGSQ
jgi:hypothetical protein